MNHTGGNGDCFGTDRGVTSLVLRYYRHQQLGKVFAYDIANVGFRRKGGGWRVEGGSGVFRVSAARAMNQDEAASLQGRYSVMAVTRRGIIRVLLHYFKHSGI